MAFRLSVAHEKQILVQSATWVDRQSGAQCWLLNNREKGMSPEFYALYERVDLDDTVQYQYSTAGLCANGDMTCEM